MPQLRVDRYGGSIRLPELPHNMEEKRPAGSRNWHTDSGAVSRIHDCRKRLHERQPRAGSVVDLQHVRRGHGLRQPASLGLPLTERSPGTPDGVPGAS